MNPLKADYSFVDLLKPETAGVLPILSALGAGSLKRIWKAYRQYRQTFAVDFDEDQEPMDESYIGGEQDPEQELFDLAEDIAGCREDIGAIDEALKGARDLVSNAIRDRRRRELFRALRATAEKHANAFNVESELPEYETAARRAVRAGYQIVVYGHTQLAKRVRLPNGSNPVPIYFNAGTWTDLIRVPDDVWALNEDSARAALYQFLADLESDNVARWRRAVPTFVEIELNDNVVVGCDAYFFDEAGKEPISTDGLRRRLTLEA
jgi:hypothetical protein